MVEVGLERVTLRDEPSEYQSVEESLEITQLWRYLTRGCTRYTPRHTSVFSALYHQQIQHQPDKAKHMIQQQPGIYYVADKPRKQLISSKTLTSLTEDVRHLVHKSLMYLRLVEAI